MNYQFMFPSINANHNAKYVALIAKPHQSCNKLQNQNVISLGYVECIKASSDVYQIDQSYCIISSLVVPKELCGIYTNWKSYDVNFLACFDCIGSYWICSKQTNLKINICSLLLLQKNLVVLRVTGKAISHYI